MKPAGRRDCVCLPTLLCLLRYLSITQGHQVQSTAHPAVYRCEVWGNSVTVLDLTMSRSQPHSAPVLIRESQSIFKTSWGKKKKKSGPGVPSRQHARDPGPITFPLWVLPPEKTKHSPVLFSSFVSVSKDSSVVSRTRERQSLQVLEVAYKVLYNLATCLPPTSPPVASSEAPPDSPCSS